MGTRKQLAICNPCREAGKTQEYNSEPGEFLITVEWMTKTRLIEHIQNTHCPICGGDNWYLTDYSMM